MASNGLNVSQHLPRIGEELETVIYKAQCYFETSSFPYPDNVALASALESIVRVNGAVPATIGVLNGIARVGLGPEELIELAASAGRSTTRKVSRRDLAYDLPISKLNGGTTVAGTMLLAHLAGIRVFCTGGLGGVHRDGENSLDISADLTELGRTPIAVVSSGCKSFLDIARTLEYLETEGVAVATFRDGRDGTVRFPAFWSRDSDIESPLAVNNELEAAQMIHAQNQLCISSALLFANPIPEQASISKNQMDSVITVAIEDAIKSSASGKDNTPFILDRIRELTGGKTVSANRALIESNAIRATKIAIELSALEKKGSEARQDHSELNDAPTKRLLRQNNLITSNQETLQVPGGIPPPATILSSDQSAGSESSVEIIVAGSLALDYSCDYAPVMRSNTLLDQTPQLYTSNEAKIRSSLGGVGHNVAAAAHLMGASVRLRSRVADDSCGRQALNLLRRKGMSTESIQVLDVTATQGTGRYVAVNDGHRALFTGMADMTIFDQVSTDIEGIWNTGGKPKWVVVDANWHDSTIHKLIRSGKAGGAKVAFEPVSAAKAVRLFKKQAVGTSELGVYPSHQIDLLAPNAIELDSMHAAAQSEEIFQRQDWWHVINSLGIPSSGARDQIVSITDSTLADEGVPQRAIQLLPFSPCIITKLGARGLLLTQILGADDARLRLASAAPYILSRSSGSESPVGGVYMRLFPAAETVPADKIISVNGVGDTLLGVLLAGLVRTNDFNVEDLIPMAQMASVMTLKSDQSVHPDIGRLLDDEEIRRHLN
ncbi:MAG: hypothetical protein M1825_001652 [Sarcosagium campestre]|nr:MAG: hypothetical protein M1825_001652 [Sarcosagium campestre]